MKLLIAEVGSKHDVSLLNFTLSDLKNGGDDLHPAAALASHLTHIRGHTKPKHFKIIGYI